MLGLRGGRGRDELAFLGKGFGFAWSVSCLMGSSMAVTQARDGDGRFA